MSFRIRWMAAVYDIVDHRTGELRTHIGVPEVGRDYLIEMLEDLQAIAGHVALYLPETTPDEYGPGRKRGKVIAVARALRLPRNKTIADYGYPGLDDSPQWPIDFPCEICYPDESNCPALRELAEQYIAEGFRPFAKLLRDGPVRLNQMMQAALNAHFDSA